MMPKEARKSVMSLKVHQWIAEWENIEFDPASYRRKPNDHFFIFSLRAGELNALSGIYRRSAKIGDKRTDDLGIQRRHDPERSDEISRYVQFGFPWSTLSAAKREQEEFADLRKPGWLPTAIVVNILTKQDTRHGKAVDSADLITVEQVQDSLHRVWLPESFSSSGWTRSGSVPPIEVIDGQHRLFAFGEGKDSSYELPVVAFVGLDISWQAYLFWTINIKPKRINASLAFDLYPLLRAEDWLDRAEGHPVYRETRAQELTEALWSHPDSPYRGRINMLGESGVPYVRQAAWVRSLMASFVKSWEGRGTSGIGGLFGSRPHSEGTTLGWSRSEQAAFLVVAFYLLHRAVLECKENWAEALRHSVEEQLAFEQQKEDEDPALFGKATLLNTDQGIRGYLFVINDLCFVASDNLKLHEWGGEEGSARDDLAISKAVQSLKKEPVYEYLDEIAHQLATFDWRTSKAPELTADESRSKAAYRGSGGYRQLRLDLLDHLAAGRSGMAANAQTVKSLLE